MSAVRNEMAACEPSDLRVIVVDDDTPARESLRWLLESVGRNVIEFSCAEQFLNEYSGGPGVNVGKPLYAFGFIKSPMTLHPPIS